jgi:hypothetical protein
VPRNTYINDTYPGLNCNSTYSQYGPEYYITTNDTNAVNSTSQVCIFAGGEDPNGDSMTTYATSDGHSFYFYPQSGAGACF